MNACGAKIKAKIIRQITFFAIPFSRYESFLESREIDERLWMDLNDFRENCLDGLNRETYIYTHVHRWLFKSLNADKGLPLWRLGDEHGKSLKGSCLRVYPSCRYLLHIGDASTLSQFSSSIISFNAQCQSEKEGETEWMESRFELLEKR